MPVNRKIVKAVPTVVGSPSQPVSVPVGTVIGWDSDDPIPIGYIEANGTSFDPVRYPALAAIYEDNKTPLRYEVVRFATIAERDAYFSAPVEGLVCYVGDSRKALWKYINSAWLPFDTTWQNYTPVLVGTTTNPTLGAGSQQNGRYLQLGKLVFYQFRILFGTSGTAAGSGVYQISLPFTANVTPWGVRHIGTVRCYSPANGAAGPFAIGVWNPGDCRIEYPATWPSGAYTNIGHATPWAWGTSMEIHGTCFYEAA